MPEAIYFIPTEADYLKRRHDKSWQDLYGRRKCSVCGQHFKPGDAYTGAREGFRHVRCGGEE